MRSVGHPCIHVRSAHLSILLLDHAVLLTVETSSTRHAIDTRARRFDRSWISKLGRRMTDYLANGI